MRFRLTYRGDLKAAGNNSNRLADKRAIRRYLSPQLEELWIGHKALQGAISSDSDYSERLRNSPPTKEEEETRRLAVVGKLREPLIVGGKKFVPLVRKSHNAQCRVDILFLRRDNPGSVVQSAGDLDNRIKTLFDGLRIPHIGELTAEDSEETTYCLTEDDAFISDFSISTDFLLSGPDKNVSDVLLVLDITVSAFRYNDDNIHLMFR